MTRQAHAEDDWGMGTQRRHQRRTPVKRHGPPDSTHAMPHYSTVSYCSEVGCATLSVLYCTQDLRKYEWKKGDVVRQTAAMPEPKTTTRSSDALAEQFDGTESSATRAGSHGLFTDDSIEVLYDDVCEVLRDAMAPDKVKYSSTDSCVCL